MMTTVASIVGARPQFVKAAVVSRALRATGRVREILIHTGQHYDDNMSRVFFEELRIPEPDYHLGIGSASHGAQTGRMLEAVEQVLLKERPDWVLVYGDTNSTLAGALAAAKLHIPVAHVEAGLRSFNRRMPEEINRVLTDHASDLLFAPTRTAVANLRDEGIPETRVHLVGDVMYDAVLYYSSEANRRGQILQRMGLRDRSYVLATLHRQENTEDPHRLRAIVDGLIRVAASLRVVMPLHPRTKAALDRYDLGMARRHLWLIEPVGYLDMLNLVKHACVVATDSGGLQKEAFFFRVPCVTLRETTEWTELVELGWNLLVPSMEPGVIENTIIKCVGLRGKDGNPYGDGHAADRIAALLADTRLAS